MKELTKDNNGITLVSLIIAIILMAILVTVGTYSGINTYKSAKVTKFVAQMQLVQGKVDELTQANEEEKLGENVNQEQKSIIDKAYANNEIKDNSEEYKQSYKYFSKENLKNQLDIEDIEDEILINFETREILSLNGVEYNGKTYYTQYNLPNGQTLIDSNNNSRNISFITELSIDGLNASVSINNIGITNGTLSFAETDSEGNNTINWQTITNYTEVEKTYIANISKTGYYIFKLEDNTNRDNFEESQQPIKITLTNKPKTNEDLEAYDYAKDSDKWAYARDENYIWIPRFAYKIDPDTNVMESKYIKGNSNIATDNTYIDSTWSVHPKFTTEDGTELTGIWVMVDNRNESHIDVIELLNNSTVTLQEININE